ncbi:hypothetical protein, partial [Parasutterella excrementihominis]|uniref:hypothetical protein n=1 Tax=Parasutterella excrementihominis TaxID=487175 RepID=UPI003AF155A3
LPAQVMHLRLHLCGIMLFLLDTMEHHRPRRRADMQGRNMIGVRNGIIVRRLVARMPVLDPRKVMTGMTIAAPGVKEAIIKTTRALNPMFRQLGFSSFVLKCHERSINTKREI